MAKITSEDVLKLARLARLQLSDNEIEKYCEELSVIVDYFNLLDEADIEGLEPTSQVTGLVNVYREDEVVEQKAKPDELLKRVPKTEDRYIKVKRMI